MLPVIRTRGFYPNWIEEFFGNDYAENYNEMSNYAVPSVNVTEHHDDFLVEVAAPGMKKEDFRIELDNKMLKITSEKKNEEEKQDHKVLRREFNYCAFKRTFILPDTVEAEKIDAKHEDGILKIRIPKREEAKVKPVKEIEIR